MYTEVEFTSPGGAKSPTTIIRGWAAHIVVALFFASGVLAVALLVLGVIGLWG